MQRKKYFHHLIGILFCCVTFSSCLDDNEPETVYPTLGTVNADGKDIIIESDSYGPLVPVNPGFITSTQTDSTGQRIMAVFQYAGETAEKTSNSTSVELIRVNKVLTKKLTICDKQEQKIYMAMLQSKLPPHPSARSI